MLTKKQLEDAVKCTTAGLCCKDCAWFEEPVSCDCNKGRIFETALAYRDMLDKAYKELGKILTDDIISERIKIQLKGEIWKLLKESEVGEDG